MARRKSQKVQRPTLDEVKAQPGKYVVAMLEGAVGPLGVEAIAPLYAPPNIKLPHLLLQAYVPCQIDEMWLEDGRFRRLYNERDYIKVWRSDDLPPEPPSADLPTEIEARMSPLVKHNAYRIATNPFASDSKHPSYMMIWAKNEDASSERSVLNWELKVIRPFLQAVKIYESRFGNRPEVIKECDKRLTQIAEKTSVDAQLLL